MAERIIDPRNPSVTTVFSVLSRPGLDYMKNFKAAELEEAAALGTLGHALAERYLKGESRAALAPDLAGIEARQAGRRARVERVFDWIDGNVVGDPVWIEGRLEDPKWGFHGHPDFAVYLKDDPIPWCIDLKFVEALDPLYALQVTAYSKLLETKFTALKFQCGILQAAGEGIKFKRLKKSDGNHHWNLFIYALTLYKALPEIKI